jgi:hypothetical protein
MFHKCKTIFSLSLAILGLGAGMVLAAAPVNTAQIDSFEHRFFFHQYPQDPIEKRLERLELLMFGSIQSGTADERLSRLKVVISQRDKQSANESRQSNAPETKTKPGQYPVLNSLEWRVLKKTYPQESLDERLGRLESKIFGQSSPAMAYADRVERLQRTLGIGVGQTPSTGNLGPRPKAVPRGPYFAVPQTPGHLIMPFSSINPWGANSQFADMFRQLDEQMEQLRQLPPGQYRWQLELPPGQGNSDGHSSPVPTKVAPKPQQALPPYYDPNSI